MIYHVLTATHLSKENDMSDIIEQSASFEVHLNLCNVRFQNIGFCLGNDLKVIQHQQFPWASVLAITKTIFCSGFVRILLL